GGSTPAATGAPALARRPQHRLYVDPEHRRGLLVLGRHAGRRRASDGGYRGGDDALRWRGAAERRRNERGWRAEQRWSSGQRWSPGVQRNTAGGSDPQGSGGAGGSAGSGGISGAGGRGAGGSGGSAGSSCDPKVCTKRCTPVGPFGCCLANGTCGCTWAPLGFG